MFYNRVCEIIGLKIFVIRGDSPLEKLLRRVSKLPGTYHLRACPRKSLKVDFLFQNSRVDRSYVYHISSFLILYRFGQSVFVIVHPCGFSKKISELSLNIYFTPQS